MEKEKIGIAFLNQTKEENKEEIIKELRSLNVEAIEITDGQAPWEIAYQTGTAINQNKIHRAIVIDDFGTLAFMVLGKMANLIVAQISDEHSAHMTSEHNGANVICLGTTISSEATLKRIIAKYIQQPFAAGRHLVRTEMLGEMLKKEEVC